jgi:hypothetical protein
VGGDGTTKIACQQDCAENGGARDQVQNSASQEHNPETDNNVSGYPSWTVACTTNAGFINFMTPAFDWKLRSRLNDAVIIFFAHSFLVTDFVLFDMQRTKRAVRHMFANFCATSRGAHLGRTSYCRFWTPRSRSCNRYSISSPALTRRRSRNASHWHARTALKSTIDVMITSGQGGHTRKLYQAFLKRNGLSPARGTIPFDYSRSLPSIEFQTCRQAFQSKPPKKPFGVASSPARLLKVR